MSWRRLQDMSWTCLQQVFSVTFVDLPRRLEDILQIRFEDVLKTSWRHKKWGYLYLANLNEYVSNGSIFHKSISDESKANTKSSFRTQWFQYSSYFEIQAAFLF